MNEFRVPNGFEHRFEQQVRRRVHTYRAQSSLTCRCRMGDNRGCDVCSLS